VDRVQGRADLTFKLRDNLVFHNGRKADANDVKYSLSRLASPDSRSPSSFLLLSDVVGFEAVNKQGEKELSGVRVVDPLTVEIRLQSPPKGDSQPACPTSRWRSSPRRRWRPAGRTGPRPSPSGQALEAEGVGASLEGGLRRVPAVLRGKPKVDRLEMPIVPEAATQLAMYQNGELDVVLVPLGDYPRLKADPRWSKEMKVWDRTQVQFLALNQRVYAPFKDVRVRQAFAQAIDKQKVINQVFHGLYIPAAGMLPPGIPGYDAQLKALPYDPARAKQPGGSWLPGWEGAAPLPMAVNPVTGDYRMMAEPIAAMLKDTLGVNIEVQIQEFASFTQAMNRRDALASFMTGGARARSMPPTSRAVALRQVAAEPRELRERGVRQADRAGQRGPDRAAHQVHQAGGRAHHQGRPLIPVMYTRFVYLVSPKVKGLEMVPLGLGQPFGRSRSRARSHEAHQDRETGLEEETPWPSGTTSFPAEQQIYLDGGWGGLVGSASARALVIDMYTAFVDMAYPSRAPAPATRRA
jgi:ABC-type oligopeptide transport system substrate-binding subunit